MNGQTKHTHINSNEATGGNYAPYAIDDGIVQNSDTQHLGIKADEVDRLITTLADSLLVGIEDIGHATTYSANAVRLSIHLKPARSFVVNPVLLWAIKELPPKYYLIENNLITL